MFVVKMDLNRIIVVMNLVSYATGFHVLGMCFWALESRYFGLIKATEPSNFMDFSYCIYGLVIQFI
jgi:hypothetical protein